MFLLDCQRVEMMLDGLIGPGCEVRRIKLPFRGTQPTRLFTYVCGSILGV
jgi:hypothetical protein